MLILGLVLSGTGLVLVAISGYILLKNLFVSDEELNMLSKLPIEPSNSGMTGMTSGKIYQQLLLIQINLKNIALFT